MAWKAESIQYGPFRPTDREAYMRKSSNTELPAKKYEQIFGIKLENYRGKSVLDIGGVVNGEFASEAVRKGIKLTTLSPHAILQEGEEEYNFSQLGPKYKVVGGYMQDMSLVPSDSFDLVLSRGVTHYMPNFESEHRAALEEVVRTVRPGGRGLVEITEPLLKSEPYQSLIKELKEKYHVEFLEKPVLNYSEEGTDFIIYSLEIKKPIS